MRVHRGKVPFLYALVAAATPALVVGACGSDAQSAAADEDLRVIPAAEAVPVAAAPVAAEPVVPAEEPAQQAATEPASAAPAARPASGGTMASPAAPARTAPAAKPQPRPYQPGAPTHAPAAEPRPERAVLAVPAGAVLDLRVETELSTRNNKAGDAFHATLLEDVLNGDGTVLLPAGAHVTGRVLEARESAGSDQPAVLQLGVVSVAVAGRTLPLQARVVDVEMEVGTRDSGKETAVKVGAGAAAGALLGKIIGKDNSDAVKGGIAGAAAGTAVAMATRGGHATVEAGARMVVRLDERLIVE